jgi:hypothetical protein
MAEVNNSSNKRKSNMMMRCGGGGAGGLYGLGFIGAAVYYIQHAHSFWPVIVAILKACVWPAFLVHGLLKFLSL